MIEIWDIYIYITKNVNISGGDWHPGPQKGNNGRPTINLSAAMFSGSLHQKPSNDLNVWIPGKGFVPILDFQSFS